MPQPLSGQLSSTATKRLGGAGKLRTSGTRRSDGDCSDDEALAETVEVRNSCVRNLKDGRARFRHSRRNGGKGMAINYGMEPARVTHAVTTAFVQLARNRGSLAQTRELIAVTHWRIAQSRARLRRDDQDQHASRAATMNTVRDIAFEANIAALMGMTGEDFERLRDEARADLGRALHEYAGGNDWIAVALLAQLGHDRLHRIAQDERPLAIGIVLSALWPLMPGGGEWRSWLARMVARIDVESGRVTQPEAA
jgi:hypothetical protein